jgi:OmcA/MtrC family decaheme c-type cytochrome
LANILNGTFGTLSAAPDADGYWTATINGFPTYAAANTGVTIPATASMLTCYMDGGWTQTDIGDNFQPPQGSDTPPGAYTAYRVTPAKKVLVGGVTGNVARREVVSTAKCNDCHESLGTSYITRYYGAHSGGAVDDPALCGVCHYVNRAGNGWSGNVQYIVHAVHGIGKRTVQYARYIHVGKRPPYTEDGKGIGGYGYPGVLNNCEQCHLPGTYDFSSTATLNALPNMLWSTVVAGNIAVGAQTSPYVGNGTYGAGITYADRVNAPLGTLVNSPITHACFGCHDSPSAIEHMKINGGAFFESRESLNGGVLNAKLTKKVETCLLCHGSGRSADIKKAHGKF